jgi:WhiB family redox-sensing transcriptional regulator
MAGPDHDAAELAAWTSTLSTLEWSVDARCAQTDPEIFFPEKGGSTKDAKAVCRRCVVRAECLLAHLGEPFGIWGGHSERDRRQLKKLADNAPIDDDDHSSQEEAA